MCVCIYGMYQEEQLFIYQVARPARPAFMLPGRGAGGRPWLSDGSSPIYRPFHLHTDFPFLGGRAEGYEVGKGVKKVRVTEVHDRDRDRHTDKEISRERERDENWDLRMKFRG